MKREFTDCNVLAAKLAVYLIKHGRNGDSAIQEAAKYYNVFDSAVRACLAEKGKRE